ncbi:MAG TPA: FKBP-type peptidyl-prolyl cis-trans isomerase [Patescibacteria group bacterium]|nr:FKBP-type peptidyl-prolyl cis-trans isomerase [Patescibacteria group bacterium]
MSKQYLFVTVFLAVLVIAGGFFIYKIPNPVNSEPSQDSLTSANITGSDTNTLGAEVTPAPESAISAKQKMDDKLIIQDEVVGTGAEAVAGKNITVNYVGTLLDGTKFDSSYDRNQPFSFDLGAGQVIQGWDQGFNGMKVGGKRKLTIPPSLGYGSMDQGPIPANSTLIFEVELLSVK